MTNDYVLFYLCVTSYAEPPLRKLFSLLTRMISFRSFLRQHSAGVVSIRKYIRKADGEHLRKRLLRPAKITHESDANWLVGGHASPVRVFSNHPNVLNLESVQ